MSFQKELRIIPSTAWMVAFLCYAALCTVLWFVVPADREMAHWARAGQLVFIFVLPIIVLVMVALYGYIYADAKRRGMRYVMWTLLAIFVPDLIGVILYFILRDPVPAECPGCHNFVLAKFTFCPSCGTTVRPVCPQCGKTLEPSWVNCGYCGTKVPARA